MSVLLETTEGPIVIDLNIEHQPSLCANFLVLCKLNHYFFAPFYNVIVDDSITCGNPSYPVDSGCYGSNYFIDMSIYDERITRDKYFPVLDRPTSSPSEPEIGTVSFLEVENGLVGSKFTISLSNTVHQGQVPFGKVAEGFPVLHAINKAKVDQELRLVNDVRILQIHILHEPFVQSIEIDSVKKQSYPTEVQLQHVRLQSLVPQEQDQSTVQALALELIGDLPHYTIKPSPRVLFVARLDRATTEESLTIIFSRFGNVTNCNIIDNTKTKSNYAFVEYETKQEAESAYSRLNQQPCIIDGNEIIVDFSQSVKKPKHKPL